MSGMHRATGKALAGEDHIAQSIADILTTPLGSLVMRRDYGSRLPELIDAPLNRATSLLLIAATAGAIRRWEPRVRLTRVSLGDMSPKGWPTITIAAQRTDVPGNPPFSLSIPL
ncbi:MAG: GPW/gp25 family protein [Novosphingobium sp.]